MARWKFELDVSEPFIKALEFDISTRQLSERIAEKMKELRPSVVEEFGKSEIQTIEFDDIITMFKTYAEYGEEDENQFDVILETLYDWGDNPINHETSTCWVKVI